MSLPLIGSLHATVVEATPVSIHGDGYVDATLETEPAPGVLALSGSTLRVRMATHTFVGGREPRPGDRVRIDVLMGQITKVAVVDGPNQ